MLTVYLHLNMHQFMQICAFFYLCVSIKVCWIIGLFFPVKKEELCIKNIKLCHFNKVFVIILYWIIFNIIWIIFNNVLLCILMDCLKQCFSLDVPWEDLRLCHKNIQAICCKNLKNWQKYWNFNIQKFILWDLLFEFRFCVIKLHYLGVFCILS